MVNGMAAAGQPGLSTYEVMILHTVRSREIPKTLADVCLVLDIADVHIANYAIRKLQKGGLVTTGRAGKEKTVSVTPEGSALCDRYAALREDLLVKAVSATGADRARLPDSAALLRSLSETYDHVARTAATIR